MATMEDIAKKLGVTKGTVSKALSGATDVSETLRKSVLETAVEVGYSRNRLPNGKKLCLFIENMAYASPSDFGYDIIIGFRQMAEPAGFSVDVVPLDTISQKDVPYEEYMLQNGYLGALLLGLSLNDPWIRQFNKSHTPAVLYDNYIQVNPSTAYVGIDNNEGMTMTVSCLKELGHTKIGYLSGALGSYINQVRYSAFFRSLRKFGLPHDQSYAGNSYYFSECLEKHLPRLLDKGVTAIICSHDLLAHTVMLRCHELGIQIPGQLSIVGFDDLPLCAYTAPPLSSIRQDRLQIGKSAFYALSSLMNGTPISTLLLHAKLIQRESIGPAPAKPASDESGTCEEQRPTVQEES